MNISQAKKLVGIHAHDALSTQGALEEAIRFCEADIADSQKRQNASRVASLTTAKEIFEKRAWRMSRATGRRPQNATQKPPHSQKPKTSQSKQLEEARRLAGIATPIENRSQIQAAIKYCKASLKTAHPDMGGSHEQATRLIGAKKILEQCLRPSCAVCGKTINRGARRCREHQFEPQNKMLAASAKPIEPQLHRAKANARVFVVTDPMSLTGYYTPPVQKVVSKWLSTIKEETLQGYFVAVRQVVKDKETLLSIKAVGPKDWPAVFELGSAACAVYGDKSKLAFWLLTLPVNEEFNDYLPSYADIADMIRKHGGKGYTAAAIQKGLKSMKLSTSRELSKEARRLAAKIKASRGW